MLLEDDHDVPCDMSRVFIRFPGEYDLLPVLHPFSDVYLEHLSFLGYLSALALFALILLEDSFSRALTDVTASLQLLYHTGSQLVKYNTYTATVAGGAALHTFGPTGAFTCTGLAYTVANDS